MLGTLSCWWLWGIRVTSACMADTVENMATVQLLGCVNGLVFPKFSGGCLALYAIGRVIYGYGYTNGGPSGRMAGGLISHLADIPLWICTGYSAAKLLGYAGN